MSINLHLSDHKARCPLLQTPSETSCLLGRAPGNDEFAKKVYLDWVASELSDFLEEETSKIEKFMKAHPRARWGAW